MIFPRPLTFAKAMLQVAHVWLRGDEVLASAPRRALRSALCKTCFEYDHGQCQKCSCFIKLKILLTSEACPLKKWGRVDNGPR